MEPELSCVAALHSPSTGIIDSHALMLAYLGDAQNAGAMLALKSRLDRAVVRANGIELHVGGAEPLIASLVVNSAGLTAPAVARRIEGYPADKAPRELYAKGNYYTLARRAPFSRLVYPVPEPGGLGVHVTLDLGGRARFGPDVEWVERIELQRGSGPRRALLCGDPPLLAGTARRRARAGLLPASGPRPRAGTNRRRTSSCRGRASTACAAWCSCTASSRRD